MTRFYSRIEVKVVGGIVHAKLFDGECVECIATTREAAITAAMEVLDQLTPDDGSSEDIIPMARRVAAG